MYQLRTIDRIRSYDDVRGKPQNDSFIPIVQSVHKGKTGDANLTGMERNRVANIHKVSSF